MAPHHTVLAEFALQKQATICLHRQAYSLLPLVTIFSILNCIRVYPSKTKYASMV